MGYLRQVRLGRAHHDLQNSTPDSDTATAVAPTGGVSPTPATSAASTARPTASPPARHSERASRDE